VNWDDLVAFRAVAEELSFARAAERVLVSSPALSQRVKRLERQLGVRLLERTTRRVELTPAGQVLLEEVDGLAAAWDRARQRLDGVQPDPHRLAPVLGVLDLRPARVLAHLARSGPAREWRTALAGSALDGDRALRAGHTHALVGYAHPSDPWPALAGLAQATVVREPLSVCLAAGHPLAAAEAVRLDQLAGESWIARVEPEIRDSVAAVCRAAGFTPRFAHMTSDFDKIRELVASGQGVILSSPCWRITEDIARRPLVDPPHGEVRLRWDPERVGADWAEALLPPLRAWYAAVAAAHNPAWWAHVRTHPREFPGVPTGVAPC
jgi:DNA-binding transcriptional LysR family regulator